MFDTRTVTLLLGVWLLVPAIARADADVDRGHELLTEAEFEAALLAFERAEDSGELARTELLSLLEGRVMAYVALGRTDELEAALRMLAAVDPRHELGPEVPPAVRRKLSRLSQAVARPPSVETSTDAAPEGIAIEAMGDDSDTGIIERVVVHARVAGGSWQQHADRVVVPAAAGDRVQYWVEALGPGGAVLASDGSADEPRIALRAHRAPPIPRHREDGRGARTWLWVGVTGATVAVAAAVGVGIAMAGGGGSADGTQPELPTVVGF